MSARPLITPSHHGLLAIFALFFVGAPAAWEVADALRPEPPPIPAALRGERLDQPAIDFELTTLEGQPLRLSELKGKVVLVNFWATWCPPCVEELPSLQRLYGRLKGEGFELLAVSEDEGADEVRAFFKGQLPDFPILMDEGQGVTRSYGTFKFPETWVVDREGRLRALFVGPRDWDDPAAIDYFLALSE